MLPLIKNMVTNRQDVVQKQVDDSAEAERLNAEAQAALRRRPWTRPSRRPPASVTTPAPMPPASRKSCVEQAKAEVERMKQRGRTSSSPSATSWCAGCAAEVGGQSMELAERLVREKLSDEASRSASVDSFLAQLGDLTQRGAKADASTGSGTSGGGA